jgi:hypothetical protein
MHTQDESPLRGSIRDPDFRRARAVKAGRARQTPQAHINALIRQAGQLTAEDIARLRVLLPEPGPDAEPT